MERLLLGRMYSVRDTCQESPAEIEGPRELPVLAADSNGRWLARALVIYPASAAFRSAANGCPIHEPVSARQVIE